MRTAHRTHLAVAAVLAVSAVLTASCGSSTLSAPHSGSRPSGAAEVNPAGDIPDNQVYVPFTPPGGLFTVSVPEGWSRSSDGAVTTFTDKSNTVRIDTIPRASAPSEASVRAEDLPAIASATAGYVPGTITTVHRASGVAVLITYQGTSAVNPVTGKSVPDAVERYEFWRNGQEVILTLSGPVGADNVDPWRTITDSLKWSS